MTPRTRLALRLVGLACLAGIVTTCRDSFFPTLEDKTRPTFAIVDGAHGGNPDVFFYPPLTSDPSGSPGFGDRPANPDLAVVARICRLNATEANPNPASLGCVATLMPDLPMTFNPSNQLYQANLKDGGFSLDNNFMYRVEIFVGLASLAFRDVDPDPKPPTASCSDEPFCQFNSKSGLPIKVRIETAALCFDPGSGTFNLPCASATIGVGGTLVLEDEGEVISTVTLVGQPLGSASAQAPSNGGTVTTITLSPCQPTTAITDLVDLPTFSDCVDIQTDPPLDDLAGVVGVATLCQAVGSGLEPAQAARITILNLRSDGFVWALPDAEGDCPEPSPAPLNVGLSRFDRLLQFAGTGWQTVREQVRSWLIPRLVLACDVGCGGWDFDSPVQAALPAKMDYDPSNPDGDLGVHNPGSEVTATVLVTDAGGDPVENATLSFSANGGSAVAVSPATDADGQFAVTWTLPNEAGTYTLTVTGMGIADPSCGEDCGPQGVFAPDHAEGTSADAVRLGEGSLTFTAVVCHVGFGTPESIDGIIATGEWTCAHQRNDVTVNLSLTSSVMATLRWMNDETNFYLALEVPASAEHNLLRVEWSNDEVLTGGRALGDDVWRFAPIATPDDKFVNEECVTSTSFDCGLRDRVGGGANQTVAAFNNSGGKTVYEMAHPLNTSETCTVAGATACGSTTGFPIDLPAVAGQTKGFFLTILLGQFTDWPGFQSYLPVTIQAPPPTP